jgi:hypothetical protein
VCSSRHRKSHTSDFFTLSFISWHFLMSSLLSKLNELVLDHPKHPFFMSLSVSLFFPTIRTDCCTQFLSPVC